MKAVRALNVSKGTEVAARVRTALSLMDRTIGLLGTDRLPDGEGLWLKPCRSVHTFFMRYPIDVLFIDQEGTVLRCGTLPPWRLSAWIRRAEGVLELPAGTAQRSRTVVGDRIEMNEEAR
jgi:uncharacterized protein